MTLAKLIISERTPIMFTNDDAPKHVNKTNEICTILKSHMRLLSCAFLVANCRATEISTF